MLREMVATINVLYYSRSPTNKDVAGQLLRQLIYEWDFGASPCSLLPAQNLICQLAPSASRPPCDDSEWWQA